MVLAYIAEDNGCTIKRLWQEGGSARLESSKPGLRADAAFTPEDVIQGKVVGSSGGISARLAAALIPRADTDPLACIPLPTAPQQLRDVVMGDGGGAVAVGAGRAFLVRGPGVRTAPQWPTSQSPGRAG